MYRSRCEVGSHQVVEKDCRTPWVIGPISILQLSDMKFDLLAPAAFRRMWRSRPPGGGRFGQEVATVRIAERHEIGG
jgi:hypothetical protein